MSSIVKSQSDMSSADSGDRHLGHIVEQLTQRLQAGESGALDRAVAEHPEFASALQRLYPTIEALAELRDSVSAGVGSLARCSETPLLEIEALRLEGQSPAVTPGAPQLGDYKILREVGRGGMGIVYEAEQISLERRVALKVLPFAAALDPRQLQRFRHEALAAASLHHEHIVPVYSIGCDRGVHFYAMQFIEGCTLADVIRELGDGGQGTGNREQIKVQGSKFKVDSTSEALNLELGTLNSAAAATKPIASLLTNGSGKRDRHFFRRAAKLIADAADALEHAHNLGIVHRDIKPANLLLDGRGKILISDFGLARIGQDTGLTMSGDILGTLRYMAPEQALPDHGIVDQRADIYALGSSLYELLTSHAAVPATKRAEILHHIAFGEPIAPRKHSQDIPAELETIVLACLAKCPGERYATAGQLADDLRRWLDDKQILARRSSLPQTLARWSRRHRYLVRSAIVAVLIAAFSLSFTTYVLWRKELQMRSAYAAAAEQLQEALLKVEQQRSIEVFLRHIHCVLPSSDQKHLPAEVNDEVCGWLSVHTPRGLIGPYESPAGPFGPYRVPEQPRSDGRWLFREQHHTEPHGWVGPQFTVYGTPSILKADIGRGETIDFELRLLGHHERARPNSGRADDQGEKSIEGDRDTAPAEGRLLGSVRGRLRNDGGSIKSEWAAGEFAVENTAAHIERILDRGPHTAHFTLSGAGAMYNMALGVHVSQPPQDRLPKLIPQPVNKNKTGQ